MWEAINKLFLLVRTGPQARAAALHSLFGELRNYAHLFQGAADATMEHGEAYEFIRARAAPRAGREDGAHRRRALPGARADEDDAFRPRALGDLLAVCSAFEAYVRRHGTSFEPVPVADELVRSPDSPRSVRHCVVNCLDAVERIGSDNRAPRRLLGRLAADLEFEEPIDVSGPAVSTTMARLLAGIHSVGESITKAYFASRAVPVAAITAQEVQQQQCG